MPRILLVDDDPDILHILTASLESAGHEVQSTLDPREVAGLVAGERFDAVVLDVMMPRRSGWEILEELRREPASARLPVLMLSAIGDPGNRVRGLRLGADDFLAKPFYPEELIERVEKMVRGSAPEALSGDFATIPVSEVLQSLAANAATGALEIVAGTESGRVLLAEGRCVAAIWGGLQDADAFLALFGTQAGTFRFYPGSVGKPSAILPPIQNLLLEAAWISDELRARESWLPPPDQPLLLVSPAIATFEPPGGLSLPTQAVVAVLRNRSGAGLADLLAAHLGAPSRVRLTVACLLEAGLLTVATADGPITAASQPAAVPVHQQRQNPRLGHPPLVHEVVLGDGDPVTAELGLLLDELVQETTLRGMPAEPVEIALLVEPGEDAALFQLLSSAAPVVDWLRSEKTSVVIRHGSSELRLHVRRQAVEVPAGEELAVRGCAAVVLWLGESPREAATQRLAADVARIADARATLLAVAKGGRASLPQRRIRVAERPPHSLADLLLAILSPLLDMLDE